jgi:nucleoside-diphosphate-sugar epimerase
MQEEVGSGMLSVLVIGKRGFIATSLARTLAERGFAVDVRGRPELDFLDDASVDAVVAGGERWDAMVFTPVKGGRRTLVDSLQDIEDNLHMHRNMLKLVPLCRLTFVFGSGAAFGRQRSIHRVSSAELGKVVPNDPYGLSKMLIELDCRRFDSIVNLRLFNCFGVGEAKDRMITATIERARQGLPPVIHQDREFDFFWVEDLATVVVHYLAALQEGQESLDRLPREMNCVCKEKHRLSKIAELVAEMVGGGGGNNGVLGGRVLVECDDGISYSGCCEVPPCMGISGMAAGLECMTFDSSCSTSSQDVHITECGQSMHTTEGLRVTQSRGPYTRMGLDNGVRPPSH